MSNFKTKAAEYKNRVFGYEVETRAAFFVLAVLLADAVLGAVSVFAFAIYLLTRKKGHLLVKKQNLIGTMFGALMLIVSAVYLNYFGVLATLYFLAIILITFSFRENVTKQKIDDIFSLAIAYSVVAFAIAVVQKIFGWSAIPGRTESTFFNALYYCYYASFVAIICLYRVVFENRNKLVYLSLMAMNILAMLVSASKMPLVGIAVAIFVMLIFAKKWKVVTVLCVLAVVVGVGALWAFNQYGLAEKLNMNSFTDSFTQRFPYWEQAINGFSKKPIFGHGILGFLKENIDKSVIATNYKFDASDISKSLDDLKGLGWHLHAHNFVLDCLYNYGLVGSALLLTAAAKRFRELYKDCKKNIFNPTVVLVISCFVFIFIDGLVDCQIIGPQTVFISIFLYAITGIYKDRKEIKNEIH